MRIWSRAELEGVEEEFKILDTTERSQFGVMVLQPGDTSGEFGNEHADADQWLVVLSGEGEAVGESGTEKIVSGDVVVVPAPEKHQFRCTGREPLRTITFYAPPGYRL